MLKRLMCFILCVIIFTPFCDAEIIGNTQLCTKDGFLDVEVESLKYDIDSFAETTADKYSGKKALAVLGEDKTVPDVAEEAQLDLSFTADVSGTYTMWLRHTASVATKSGQNFFLSIQNKAYSTLQLTAEADDPTWVKMGTVSLGAGETASVRVRKRQKQSIGLDRYIVSNNTSYKPTDVNVGLAKEIIKENKDISLKDGYAFFEAESLTSYGGFADIHSNTASKGHALSSNFDASALKSSDMPSHLEFNFIADENNKTYYIWVYAMPSEANRSILISFNNSQYSTYSLGSDTTKFSWIRIGQIRGIPKGEKVNVRIRNLTKNYLLDCFAITDDIMKQPAGNYGDLIMRDTTIKSNPYSTPEKLEVSHPRVYFTQKDIPVILENAQKEENQQAWKYQQMNLSVAHEDGFTAKLEPPASGSNSSEGILGIIESLAFDYAICKNVENGKLAVAEMTNYLQTVVLEGRFDDAYTRPGGHLVFTAAEVYDWCYNLLRDEDKDYITERCIEIIGDGIEVRWPPTAMQATTGHGGEAQLQRDILAFAIAIADERPDVYELVVGRILTEYMPVRQFTGASNWNHQGTHYAGYRTQWDYNAIWEMDKIGYPNVYGDGHRFLPYSFIYGRRPDGQIFSDGDDPRQEAVIGNYATAYSAVRAIFLAGTYYNDPYLKLEYARNNKNLSNFAYGHGFTSPVEFLCLNKPDVKAETCDTLPLVKYYGTPQGAMIARSSWDDGMNSPAAMALMKVNEYWFGNHQHMDAGHFEIYYKGILANDAGTYRGALYSSNHTELFTKRSIAHNTITVTNPNEEFSYMGSIKTVTGGQKSINDGESAKSLADLKSNLKIGSIEGHEIGVDASKPEYSYLKGDITDAYSSATVSDYERSFMYYNLNDENRPMAMVVLDRVTATNESYKKAWLLHGPSMAKFNEKTNQTIYKNTENGYNGKLTVDTLIPSVGNTEVKIIGGEGQDAWVAGGNYSALTDSVIASAYKNPTLSHEYIDYRIEISPIKSQKEDYFLNVLQVGDAVTDENADGTEQLKVSCIENDKVVGAIISDRITVFQKEKGRTQSDVSFSFGDAGTFKIAVTDVEAGTWSVSRNGNKLCDAVATKEGGMLYFEGTAGEYQITRIGDNAVREQKNEEKRVNNNGIDMLIDGAVTYTKTETALIDDKLMMPIRAICEKKGLTVEWRDNKAYITDENNIIIIGEGDNFANVNGKEVVFDSKVITTDGSLMVSAKCLYEVLGYVSEYDKFAKVVYVYTDIKGASIDDEGKIFYMSNHNTEDALPIYSVMASPSEVGNGITNALDEDLSSRWASEGNEYLSWGIFDLGSVKSLDKVYISFHNGNSRVYNFGIAVSEDGKNFTRVIKDGHSSGSTLELEGYTLNGVKARYVKYLGNGNTVNKWNSVTEIVITGK